MKYLWLPLSKLLSSAIRARGMKSIGCALSPHGDGLFFILKNLECLKDNSSAVDMGAAVRLWDLEGRTCTAGLENVKGPRQTGAGKQLLLYMKSYYIAPSAMYKTHCNCQVGTIWVQNRWLCKCLPIILWTRKFLIFAWIKILFQEQHLTSWGPITKWLSVT